MKTEVYESPKFEFEELRLAERVASKCWGTNYAWYDVDGDKVIDDNDIVLDIGKILGSNGCKGSNAIEAINKILVSKGLQPLPNNAVNTDDTHIIIPES